MGFGGQKPLLEQVLSWLPAGAKVRLPADRFYPSCGRFVWLQVHAWQYRLRLKNNVLADPGYGDEATTGVLAQGVTERCFPKVRLFAPGIMTNLGILHEAGHPEPWIIAMDCPPTLAAALDYGARRGIKPMFSDFKSRRFELKDSQLKQADRLERWVLIMSLALYGCVHIGRQDAANDPTPPEKNARANPLRTLELQKAPPQLGFLVQARVTIPDALPSE